MIFRFGTLPPQPFYGPFSGTTRVSRCQKTEADTPAIRLGATPSGLSSANLHHPPFLQARCPSCHPTNSVKALKATSAFGLGRRRYSSPQRCYLHCLRTICTISAPFFRSPYRKGDIEARKRCRKEQQKFYQD